MTHKVQEVTLRIAFDDEHYNPPAEWDWFTILDTSDQCVLLDLRESEVTLPSDKDRENLERRPPPWDTK